ncbi:hypothetical protein [Yoonia sp. MH D7]
MKRIVSAAISILFAGQAAALSCLPPDAVQTFNTLSADEANYFVLYGALDFDTEKQPQGVVNEPRNPDPVPARFTGKGLTETGFDNDFIRDVTLQPLCAGPWCGSAAAQVPSLIFAKVAGDNIIIEVSPCGGTIFPEPSPATLENMTACMAGTCVSAEPLQ